MKYKTRILETSFGKIKFFFRPSRLDKGDDGIIDEIWFDNIDVDNELKIKSYFTVIDIGAHIGVFTVYAAKQAKKVFSYEPSPETFTLLKRNIEINNIKNASIYNYAVLDKKGKTKLFFGNTSMEDSLYKETNESTIVKKFSLKDIFDENKINFCHLLKIDAEGSEYEILRNTPDGYLKKINRIILEYHDFIFRNDSLNLTKFLIKKHFKIQKIHPLSNKHGLIFVKQSKNSKIILLYQNYLKCFISRPFKLLLAKINYFIGRAGIFLKKYFPKLYFKLKNVEKIKK